MAIPTAQLDADLAAIEADLPTSFTVGGVSVACTLGSVNLGRSLYPPGMEYEYRKSAWYRKAVYANEIRPGAAVTISGVIFRVLDVVTSDDGRLVRLDLGERFSQ